MTFQTGSKGKSTIVSIVKLIIIYTLHRRNGGGLHTSPAKEAHPLTERISTDFQILP